MSEPSNPNVNYQVQLKSRPQGLPKLSDFQIVETAIPSPNDSEMLIQTFYLSPDPGVRAMIEAGETVVVSGAADAVDMAAGQIAKLQGRRVVGTAGSAEKVDYLRDELGFDAVINYKTAPDLTTALSDACPNGIDVYFDNVGGEVTQAAMSLINYHARIVVCGQTSQYNDAVGNNGAIAPNLLIKSSAKMEGFVVYDFEHRNDEAIQQLGQWIKEGTLQYKENIVAGLENTLQAFIDLFSSKIFGKQLIKLTDDIDC